MSTIRQALDRIEITDVLVRYSHALDYEWWPLLDSVFTEDAVFDGELAGLGVTDIPSFVAQLPALYETRLSGVHSLGPVNVDVEGDRGRAVTEFTTVSVTALPEGAVTRTRSSGTYFDELVRTERGWRLARRQATFKASVTEPLDLDVDWRARIAATGAALRESAPV